MSKREPVFKKFRLELTKDSFYVVIANDLIEGFELLKSVDKKLKDYQFPTQKQNWDAVCFTRPALGITAVFFSFNAIKAFYICHEVSHATHSILQSVGLELNDATDEVYAYHNDMLFRYCTDFMKENKLRIKV